MVFINEETFEALEDYTGGSSTALRKIEAGVLDEDYEEYYQLKEQVDYINDFLDKAPKVEAEIYSGFKNEMVEVYGLKNLKEGDTFTLPSMTSFSTDTDIAESFDGAGFIKIINNKSGASIKNISNFYHESEVLVPKKAKYKLIKIEEGRYKKQYYTLEEQ